MTKFDFTKFTERTCVNLQDKPKAWVLLERCVEELGTRGIAPQYVQGVHDPEAYDKDVDFDEMPIGWRYITVHTVGRHNGTDEDVSVHIIVYEKEGKHTARTICKVKVPKDASDKVINRRIDKVLESM